MIDPKLWLMPPKPKQHVVSIGGGLSSTIELPLEVIRKYGKENTHLVIAALAGEHPDLWRLVAECEKRTGLKVTRITYHPLRKYIVNAPEVMWWDIWDVFESQGRMGSTLADPCSRILKRETMRAYMLANFPARSTVLHVGIKADEIDRMIAIRGNWSRLGYQVEADIADLPDTGETTAEKCQRLLGWIPETYQRGNSHNNCAGFCVKAGHAEIARLWFYNRDLFLYHAEKERLFQMKHDTTATIMRDRKTVNKVVGSTPLTLYQFAERLEAKQGGMLPGFGLFDGLDSMPGCKWCDAA